MRYPDWAAARSSKRAGSPWKPRRRFALLLLCVGTLLVVLLLPASARPAAGTADEVHYTFTSPSSVGFDWRGTATDIRYGTTTSYGGTATTHTPSPLPFSSAGPLQEVEVTGLTPRATDHYSIGGGPHQIMTSAPTGGLCLHGHARAGLLWRGLGLFRRRRRPLHSVPRAVSRRHLDRLAVEGRFHLRRCPGRLVDPLHRHLRPPTRLLDWASPRGLDSGRDSRHLWDSLLEVRAQPQRAFARLRALPADQRRHSHHGGRGRSQPRDSLDEH